MTTSPRQPLPGRLFFWNAFALILWALLVNNVTMADSDYRSEVVQAIACSSVAVVLVVLGWRRMNPATRILAVFIVLAAGWTLLDAGGRRLPAILGW